MIDTVRRWCRMKKRYPDLEELPSRWWSVATAINYPA